jgi:DNA-binding NtrC family response regulator
VIRPGKTKEMEENDKRGVEFESIMDRVKEATVTLEEENAKRVLVLDDEVCVVDLVKAALELEGHRVQTSLDGESALRKIETQNFDVVISELKMPGKGGIDVFLYCREKAPNLAERFLFLTGDVVSPEIQRFFEEHHLHYLIKPFDITELNACVKHLCQTK